MNPVRIVIWVAALLFAGIGTACLVDPVTMLAGVGVDAPSGDGRAELRAMYGGLEIGLAVFLLWCERQGLQRAALLAIALSLGGLGSARAAAWLMEGMPGGLHPLLFAFELSATAIAATLFWRERPS